MVPKAVITLCNTVTGLLT